MPGTRVDQEDHDPQTATSRATLPDADEVRSTLPDLEPANEGPEEPIETPEPKGKKPSAWVYFLIGGLLFASIAGPLVFYFVAWRYRPTAVAHIPAGSTVAARFDGRELYLNAAFREHVVGALDAGGASESLAGLIKQQTNIDLRTDIREIVVATQTGEDVVILIGGHFIKARLDQKSFPEGLRAALVMQGAPPESLELQDEVLTLPTGWRIAQAEDSTIVLAKRADLVSAALPASEVYRDLGLASSGALSFVVDGPALRAIAKASPLSSTEVLTRAKRISGYYTIRKSQLFVEVVPTDGVETMALSTEFEQSLLGAQSLALLLPDVAGESTALREARVKPRAETVLIETNWPPEKIALGFEKLGALLREALASTP